MNTDGLRKPIDPLQTFSQALGGSQLDWASKEALEELRHYDENFSRDAATSLTLEQLKAMAEVYGDALTCRFLLGDMSVLDVSPGLGEEDLNRFRQEVQGSPTLTFDFVLDKQRLLATWLGTLPERCYMFLYLFPQALVRFLSSSSLTHLETKLWNGHAERKVIILVPEREIQLVGDCLAVMGGQYTDDWRKDAPTKLSTGCPTTNVNQTAQELVKWQMPWLKCLTPLHLHTSAHAGSEDDIARALQVHLINSTILYTADQTTERGKCFESTYAGDQQSIVVEWQNPQQMLSKSDTSGADSEALFQIFQWAYSQEGSPQDRLPFVQVGMVHALRSAAPTVRYQLLGQNAQAIFDDLKWHWKAFIDGKVEAYTDEVRALESVVSDTVKTFADQVSQIIERLSATLLAAVGVLLGSFIAALFKDPFDATIFRIGMGVYAAYVLCFPLVYNMRHQWERYTGLKKNFESRRRRFEDHLYQDRVQDIVKDEVETSEKRFKWWFWMTVVIYVIVIALMVLAGWWLPNVVGNTPTPSPQQ